MIELLREKLINDEYPEKYQKGISYVTLDLLDYYAEYATKMLLDKIYFYDKFHPEIFIKKGLFSDNNTESINEFNIPIDINVSIDGISYIDSLNWDLLNHEMTPENFAEIIVKDEKLSNSFIVPTSFQIRKGIHIYVYNLFKNLANNYEKYIGEDKFLLEQPKTTRHREDAKKNIPIFLFDQKLSKLLGKKRDMKMDTNENDSLLPNFLKNVKEESNIVIESKGKKNSLKTNKKLDKKKDKKMNFIEHDKQSTTVEEYE